MKLLEFLIFLCALVVFISANPIDEWDDYDYDSLEDLEGDSTFSTKLPVPGTRPPMKPVMGILEKIKSIFLIGLQTAKEIIEPIPTYF